MSHVKIIDRSVETTHIWLNEMAEELGEDDTRAAYRVLRSFLHTLRDRMTVNEAAQLASQMPELIRGIYYENWVPARTPMTYHGVDEFLGRLADEAGLDGETEASFAAAAGFRLLGRHVSQGELDDVLAVLPSEIRALAQS